MSYPIRSAIPPHHLSSINSVPSKTCRLAFPSSSLYNSHPFETVTAANLYTQPDLDRIGYVIESNRILCSKGVPLGHARPRAEDLLRELAVSPHAVPAEFFEVGFEQPRQLSQRLVVRVLVTPLRFTTAKGITETVTTIHYVGVIWCHMSYVDIYIRFSWVYIGMTTCVCTPSPSSSCLLLPFHITTLLPI